MNTKILKALEFDKVKKQFAHFLQSEQGQMELNDLLPMTNQEKIERSFAEIADVAQIFQEYASFGFGHSQDISESLRRLELGADLNTQELLAVKRILQMSAELKDFYDNLENVDLQILDCLFEKVEMFPNLQGSLQAINDGGFIEDFASPELTKIRHHIHQNEQQIRQILQEMLKKQGDLLAENLIASRSGRSVLPVKNTYRHRIAGVIHDISDSGNTVYIEPRAVVNLNEEMTQARADERHEMTRILHDLSDRLILQTDIIGNNAWLLGHIDFVRGKYLYMRENQASLPSLTTDQTIRLLSVRHPLLSNPIANDLHFEHDTTAILITGPNTGGKTIMLKTLGITQLMAQSGLPILADEGSKVAVFKDIFADIGDEQSIEQSLSTFSSHMTHIVEILQKANKDSLVLFDELGAGTDPQEGAALAMSILEHLRLSDIKTMITTHYPELKAYGIETEFIENASMEFDMVTLSPTYHFMQGVPGLLNAFEIARRLGLSEIIVAEAENLTNTDSDVNKIIERLENQTIESRRRLDNIREVEQENLKFNRAVKKLYNEFSHAQDKELRKANQRLKRLLTRLLQRVILFSKIFKTKHNLSPMKLLKLKASSRSWFPR